MVKAKEYSQDERVAIKYLREAGHSCAEIARQVGCSKSTEHYIYKSLERSGSAKKGARTGRPKKISERGERIGGMEVPAKQPKNFDTFVGLNLAKMPLVQEFNSYVFFFNIDKPCCHECLEQVFSTDLEEIKKQTEIFAFIQFA